MAPIKHKVLVLSGKGGVGKSTTAAWLALDLVRRGYRVGLLDVDLCGPSLPKMMGVDDASVRQAPEGWLPVPVNAERSLFLMSLAFLLSSKADAVVWRGPRKNAMITQFLRDVLWGELDFLVVDTPPGTSDEHISVVQMLQSCSPDGAVLVSTPQNVALDDVRRQLTFCERTGLRVLGIVENMAGFVCPCCGEITNVFGDGGAEALAQLKALPFLGRVPLDPRIGAGAERGLARLDDSSAVVLDAFRAVVDAVLVQVAPEAPSSSASAT